MANKLELTWIGKDEKINIEPRILLYDKDKSYGEQNTDNMLIHGDNLLALKALEQMGIKFDCIYIDPPYNTGDAFEEYEDKLEHSIWLNLMYNRIKLLYKLLSETGVIFVQLNDDEMNYCKVLMDEICGRSNYINIISLFTKVSAGASGGGEDRKLKKNIEYILIYAKNFSAFKTFKPIYKSTLLENYISSMREQHKSYKYTNVLLRCENLTPYKVVKDGSGDDIQIQRVNDYKITTVKQLAKDEGVSEEKIYEKYFDQIMTTTNAQTSIRTRVWKATDSENNMYLASYMPKSGKFKGTQRDLIFMGKQKVLVIWLKDTAEKKNGKIYKKERIGTFWDGFSWINVNKEGGVHFTGGKKPEQLLEQILNMATEPGDLVLDSFLGSGTTAAVAHKMNRRYIGIELGEHAYTHCKVRLDRVIDGDESGISKEVNWQGGGGYKFYELAPSLLKKDTFGEYIINPEYDADKLAAAVALHEGFTYEPSTELFWKQAVGSENSYLFTTTKHLNGTYLDSIASTMNDNEYLLIACKSFDKGLAGTYKNITIKKIPQILLDKCEFDVENYNLNIVNPPVYEDDGEEDSDE